MVQQPSPQTSPQPNQKNELLELAGLLADLKKRWPDIYRHLIGLIKTVNSK
jgi:hypothetical protein